MKSPLSVLSVTVLVTPLCALAGIVVEPSFVDLGTVRTAERPVRAFALRNDGTNAVRLTELVRTCVCGTPTVGKRSLAPGEGTALRLALDPSLLPDGPFLKTFYVRTDDPQTPVVDVTVRGEVVPEWRVAPSRRVHLDAEASTAVFEVRDGAVPATFDRCAVQDAEGRPVDIPAQLTPLAGGGVRVAFTPPADGAGTFRAWSLVLAANGNTAAALRLAVSTGRGAVWRCDPRRVRLPPPRGDGAVALPVRLVVESAARTRVAAVRPERIALAEAPPGVQVVPDGTVTWKAIPLSIRFDSETARAWRPRSLRIVLPDGLGTADVFVDVPPRRGEVGP